MLGPWRRLNSHLRQSPPPASVPVASRRKFAPAWHRQSWAHFRFPTATRLGVQYRYYSMCPWVRHCSTFRRDSYFSAAGLLVMPELPRDPRQLARDILSGKVRIEDLARQRQLRGPGGAGTADPRMPDKIPLPRSPQRVPQPPYQAPRPQQRPMPPVRQTPAPRPSGPYQRPQPPRPMPPPVQRQVSRPPPAAAPQPQTMAPAAPAPGPGAPPRVVARRPVRMHQLVRSKLALRQGVLLAEILGPPVSERG
jgi:hypothetical protein